MKYQFVGVVSRTPLKRNSIRVLITKRYFQMKNFCFDHKYSRLAANSDLPFSHTCFRANTHLGLNGRL